MLERPSFPSRAASAEAVMAWAERAPDRQVIHVSMLSRSETGLACGCVCAGCGAALEAVNAGRPAAHFQKRNAHRMSFRHQAGTQRGDCLRKAARAAVLHSMLQQGELALPAYRASSRYLGGSGREYPGTASNEASVEQIASYEWIDIHSALVTLASGRVVLVTLRSELRIGDEVDAVLSITTDDPELASWTPEQVLAHSRLDGSWACWERHWDQDQIKGRADQIAKAEAMVYMDAVPDCYADQDDHVLEDGPFAAPEFLHQLTGIQRGETLLHLHLKHLLGSMDLLQIAEQQFDVTWTSPKGLHALATVSMPARRFRLSNVRLEQHLGDIVPDVICRVVDDEDFFEESELMIEVAVSHRVDATKLAKIRARGTPCLEIDATKLGIAGQLTADQLAKLLQKTSSAVRWLYHPHLDSLAAAARTRLAADNELRQRAEARQQAEERERQQAKERVERERVQAQKAQQLKLQALGQRLRGLQPKQMFFDYAEALIANRPATHLPIWRDDVQATYAAAFERAGRSYCADKALQTLIVVLHTLLRAAPLIPTSASSSTNCLEILKLANDLQQMSLWPYMPLLLRAIKVRGTKSLDSGERSQVLEIAEQVRRSVEQGETRYARHTTYDPALAVLFPELREMLKAGVPGTIVFADSTRLRKQQDAAAQLVREEALEAQRLKEAREEAIQPAMYRNWSRGGGVVFEKWPRYAQVRGMHWRHVDLIRGAYEAREQGISVPDFFRGLQIQSKDEVQQKLRTLGDVYLLA